MFGSSACDEHVHSCQANTDTQTAFYQLISLMQETDVALAEDIGKVLSSMPLQNLNRIFLSLAKQAKVSDWESKYNFD